MDECSLNDANNCSQMCNNTKGSYQCFCEDGYVLDLSDNFTCNGITIPVLYVHLIVCTLQQFSMHALYAALQI